MLDYMFKDRSREEDAILNLEEELKKYKSEVNFKENTHSKEISDLSEQIRNIPKEKADLSFIEKGLYIQMLMLVGRTKDAKEAAKDWIRKYEEVNIVKEPTQEQKKAIEKNIEELTKSLTPQHKR